MVCVDTCSLKWVRPGGLNLGGFHSLYLANCSWTLQLILEEHSISKYPGDAYEGTLVACQISLDKRAKWAQYLLPHDHQLVLESPKLHFCD